MHALADYPDLRYVLGLQEAIVVAMADGYAQGFRRSWSHATSMLRQGSATPWVRCLRRSIPAPRSSSRPDSRRDNHQDRLRSP